MYMVIDAELYNVDTSHEGFCASSGPPDLALGLHNLNFRDHEDAL